MRSRAFRKGLQSVHLWAGLVLSLPFIVIGLSGSILVLLSGGPDLSVPQASAQGPRQPIANILAAAAAVTPPGLVLSGVTLPQAQGEPAAVEMTLPPGRRPAGGFRANTGHMVYVDPVSLKILGSVERLRANAFNRTLHTLHETLMFPAYFGLQVVGWLGIAMVVFGFSGLVLWWPGRGQWRQAFGIRRGARGFRLHRDIHGAVGFWSLGLFLLISISGVDLVFPVTFQSAMRALLPVEGRLTDGQADAATLAAIAGHGSLTADAAVKMALAAVPDAHAVAVELPPIADGLYMVSLQPDGYSDDAPQISVFVGPGALVSDVVDPRSYTLGKRILVWLRVLHYGHGLGVVYKILVFFSGLLPLLFAVTGVRMWWLKRARRHAALPEAAAIPAE